VKYKQHTNCRVCNSTDLQIYLDLGLLPLSNNLANNARTDPIHYEKYPLQVLLCGECGLSQLSIVIPPEILFSNYVYRSSISQGYVNHCRKMAETLKEKYDLTDESFCIDIAGNDGALLYEFKSVLAGDFNMYLNIDPAKNLFPLNRVKDINMRCQFWSKEVAQETVNFHKRSADIITATNVFAHVDNVREFIEAAKIVLKPTGKLILEFPYLIDFIEKREFDTVYFEHLSYFSISPLYRLCKEVGLNIESVERFEIHGGSVRVTVGYGESDGTPELFIEKELPYKSIDIYIEFEQAVKKVIQQFYENRMQIADVAGFAASAKGNTLLNCAGVVLKYIIDETPEKIGKYSPGVFTPIVGIDVFKYDNPEYLVILAWNFADEIMSKCRAAGFTGKFIIPIPEWQIVQ
jgi:SAM-dependent methyltransferase